MRSAANQTGTKRWLFHWLAAQAEGKTLYESLVGPGGVPPHCDSNDLFCPASSNAGLETKRQSPRLSSTLSGCASPNEKARAAVAPTTGQKAPLNASSVYRVRSPPRKYICAAASTPVRQRAVDARHTLPTERLARPHGDQGLAVPETRPKAPAGTLKRESVPRRPRRACSPEGTNARAETTRHLPRWCKHPSGPR